MHCVRLRLARHNLYLGEGRTGIDAQIAARSVGGEHEGVAEDDAADAVPRHFHLAEARAGVDVDAQPLRHDYFRRAEERGDAQEVLTLAQLGHAHVGLHLTEDRLHLRLRPQLPQDAAAIHLAEEGDDVMPSLAAGRARRERWARNRLSQLICRLGRQLFQNGAALRRVARHHQCAHQPAELLQRQAAPPSPTQRGSAPAPARGSSAPPPAARPDSRVAHRPPRPADAPTVRRPGSRDWSPAPPSSAATWRGAPPARRWRRVRHPRAAARRCWRARRAWWRRDRPYFRSTSRSRPYSNWPPR